MADGLISIFDRDFNKLDPKGKEDWDTIRDLNRVWAHPIVASHGFDASNTLLIECEPRKAREWKANTISPTEYTKKDVIAKKKDRTLHEEG